MSVVGESSCTTDCVNIRSEKLAFGFNPFNTFKKFFKIFVNFFVYQGSPDSTWRSVAFGRAFLFIATQICPSIGKMRVSTEAARGIQVGVLTFNALLIIGKVGSRALQPSNIRRLLAGWRLPRAF